MSTATANPDTCVIAKVAYEKAFLKWYEEVFVPGKGKVRDMCCKDEFEVYQKCTQEWMAVRGLDQKLKKWEARQHDD